MQFVTYFKINKDYQSSHNSHNGRIVQTIDHYLFIFFILHELIFYPTPKKCKINVKVPHHIFCLVFTVNKQKRFALYYINTHSN